MKKNNQKGNNKAVVKLKKLFYRNKIGGFKRVAALMVIGGILLAGLYSIRHVYTEYAIACANVSLLYPEIAGAQYPDNSRFTYYDIVSDDKIDKALEIMRKDGMYENYTVMDIKNNIYVTNYLTGSAKDAVSSLRSEGNDYSYVANEYLVTFVQPHDYKNSSLFKKFFTPDYSEKFLEALVEVNKQELTNVYGGYEGFEMLTDMGDISGYDYSELVSIYRTKISSVIDYLNELETASPGFVSQSTGMGVKDVVGEYDLLVTNKLDAISSFIDTSAISRDKQIASNKTKVNIENNKLKLVQFGDEVIINENAQNKYDHTFTENLIVVTIHEQSGLYQARPKTAFDTVVEKKHEATKQVESFTTKLSALEKELASYQGTVVSAAEYTRLCQKCEDLLAGLEKEYLDITGIARTVVCEYNISVNKDYLKTHIASKGLISSNYVVNAGLTFAIGAVVVFIAYVALSIIRDRSKMNKKAKMLRNIREDGRSV